MYPAMKNLFYLLLPILFLVGVSSCQSGEDITPPAPEFYNLEIQIDHFFDGDPFQMLEYAHANAAGNQLNFFTFKYLISGVYLTNTDGQVVEMPETYGFINPQGDRNSFVIENIPAGTYSGLAFMIGLDPEVNNSNPNAWPANHPLSPLVNNMHWDWSTGYIFLSMEGSYKENASSTEEDGFSYHIAFEENQMPFEWSNETLELDRDRKAILQFDVGEVFKNPEIFDIVQRGNVSHSSGDNGIANTLRDNVADALKLDRYE
jgi:hypothetical protein